MEKFSKKGWIEKNIAEHRRYKIQEDDGQFIVLFVGDTGTSKTSLSILLEHYIRDGSIDLDTICLTHDKFISEYTSKPKEKIIIHEEGRETFDKNKYNQKETSEARDRINQYRKFHHTLFINFQNPNHLTYEIVRNADALIRTPAKGIAHYYSKPEISKMWDERSGKFTGWRDYDVRDFFPDPANYISETWNRYEERVEEELEQRGEEIDAGEDEEDDSAIPGVEKQFKIQTVADQLDLHPETLRRRCRSDEIDYTKVQGEYRIPESQVQELVET